MSLEVGIVSAGHGRRPGRPVPVAEAAVEEPCQRDAEQEQDPLEDARAIVESQPVGPGWHVDPDQAGRERHGRSRRPVHGRTPARVEGRAEEHGGVGRRLHGDLGFASVGFAARDAASAAQQQLDAAGALPGTPGEGDVVFVVRRHDARGAGPLHVRVPVFRRGTAPAGLPAGSPAGSPQAAQAARAAVALHMAYATRDLSARSASAARAAQCEAAQAARGAPYAGTGLARGAPPSPPSPPPRCSCGHHYTRQAGLLSFAPGEAQAAILVAVARRPPCGARARAFAVDLMLPGGARVRGGEAGDRSVTVRIEWEAPGGDEGGKGGDGDDGDDEDAGEDEECGCDEDDEDDGGGDGFGGE